MKKSNTVKASFFEKDITPPAGTWLNGFGSRTSPSEGCDDPIMLRMLCLEDTEGSRALFITADVLWFHNDMSFRIKHIAEKKYGIKSSAVIINASHTHCGPVLTQNPVYPHWPVNWQYTDFFECSILEGITHTVSSLKPAVLKFGILQSHFGINRRLPLGDGKVSGSILPNEKGYYDPDLPVLAVYDNKTGDIEGLFYSYACHPSEKGGQRFSANFPGAVSRSLKKTYGANFCALFGQGAGGDIKPRFYNKEKNVFTPAKTDDVEDLGKKIAGEIAAGIHGGLCKEIQLEISSCEKEFNIPYNLDMMYPLDTLYRLTCGDADTVQVPEDKMIHSPGSSSMTRAWAKKIIEDVRLNQVEKSCRHHLTRIKLNSTAQIIGLTGEPVAELGRMIKNIFPDYATVFLGYCTSVPTYMPIARMLSEGGYESVRSCSEYLMPAPYSEDIDRIITEAVKACE